MIELKDICKSFGDHVVLKNFSLKINKNEFIAIIGESGAGKTTILNMISMIDKPDSGSISINGENSFSKKDIQNLRRYVFGYIFQNYALIENDTVKENLLLSKKYRKNFKEKELEESLEKVGISKEYLGHKVCELSGGEQQRIAIARTMLKPCEIILADEPTGNLDTSNKEKIIHLFKELKKEGKTIVCVTHDEEMAIDLWELISALKKRALIILAACLLGGVVAGVYTKLCITPMYTATSSMLVTTQETTLTSIADLQLGSALTGDYSILATSRSVLEEVIEDLGLNMNHHQLRGSITITNPEGTHIMEVTARSSDPETAKKIADTMAVVSAQYIKEKMEVAPPKIIEEAEVPSSPVSPSMNKNVMMGALAGFALAAAIVILFAIMNDSIKTEDDIERALGIPTLAVIPDRKDYIDDHGGSKKKKGKRRRQSKWRNKR